MFVETAGFKAGSSGDPPRTAVGPAVGPAVSERNCDNFSSSRGSDTLIWDLNDCTSAFSLLLSAWVTLFGSNSSSDDKHGNFQTVPCQVDKSNQVNIAFTGLSENHQNYFFYIWKSQDIKVSKLSQIFTLVEEVYAEVLEEFIGKVGSNPNTKLKSWIC